VAQDYEYYIREVIKKVVDGRCEAEEGGAHEQDMEDEEE
jgi:hypothetical protein